MGILMWVTIAVGAWCALIIPMAVAVGRSFAAGQAPRRRPVMTPLVVASDRHVRSRPAA